MPYRLIDPAGHPRIRTILHVIGGTATGLLIVGVMFLLVQTFALSDAVRETQLNNTQRSEDTKNAAEQAERAAQEAVRSSTRIEDCTTPGRECFEDSQRRLAEAITGINDFATYAAACADKPRQQTAQQIKVCIVAQIADDERRANRS